jgi:(R)-2-hydroxyacyl-CoA dehydratese activating ATPase
MICAGIDAGSRTLKVVLVDAERVRRGRETLAEPVRETLAPVGRGSPDPAEIIAAGVVDQGIDQDRLALELLQRLLRAQGLRRDDVGAIVATGYGRKLVRAADTTITEITCQARGVRHGVPQVRTIVDIGGQDSKLVRLKEDGGVGDFVMNDRCAAGTGRFLEMLAAQLGTPFSELEPLVARSRAPAVISSMCVVFAESEIVGLLAAGVPPEDIVTGVQTAIATRIAAMTGRNLAEPILFTGGVALVPGMGDALRSVFGRAVQIAPQPQLTCATGAALLAVERYAGREG